MFEKHGGLVTAEGTPGQGSAFVQVLSSVLLLLLVPLSTLHDIVLWVGDVTASMVPQCTGRKLCLVLLDVRELGL